MRKVFVHVGAPKTGTTYLQERLAVNARTLARHGVTLPTSHVWTPPDRFGFWVALDLLDREWRRPGEGQGAWDTFVRKTLRTHDSVILSHEILATAKPAHVARLHDELQVGRTTELHIVYSARDLARQVPAAWQESLKQGHGLRYRRFLEMQQARKGWFAKAFDLPRVLATWTAGLPPEQVHLVTVPRRGEAPAEELWHRYCRAFGLDPAWAPIGAVHANVSLDIAEARMLRRLNRALPPDVREDPAYDKLVRVMMAEGRLSTRTSGPIELPPDLLPWARQQGERWIEWAEAAGIDIVGDVDDLRPWASTSTTWLDPDAAYPRQELAAAIEALALMTEQAVRRPDPALRLSSKVRRHARKVLNR